MIEILYSDKDIIVCIKPRRILSTDEPGGLPQLLQEQLGGPIKTVHRLDRVVGGLMVLARSAEAARQLSAQVSGEGFGKGYLAVCYGVPDPAEGQMYDLLRRDRQERKTYVTTQPGKDARPALLDYETIKSRGGMSLVSINLHTGRTHQIRAQFSSRTLPLVGDRKYGDREQKGELALWSARLSFVHPATNEKMTYLSLPPEEPPWSQFMPI